MKSKPLALIGSGNQGRPISRVRLLATRNVLVTTIADCDETWTWEWNDDGLSALGKFGSGGEANQRVIDFAIHPVEDVIALAGAGRGIRILRLDTGEQLAELRHGHDSSGYAGVWFDPAGEQLFAACSTDERTDVFEFPSGRHITEFWGSAEGTTFALHPEGVILAQSMRSMSGDTIRFVGLNEHLEFYALEFSTYVNIGGMQFSPDGRCIAVGGGFPPIEFAVHDFPSGKGRFIWYGPEDAEVPEPWELEGSTPWLTGIAFSPDGKNVLCPSPLGEIVELDVADGRIGREWPCHDAMVTCLDIRHRDGVLASVAQDGTLCLWRSPYSQRPNPVSGRDVTSEFLAQTKQVSAFASWTEMDTIEDEDED